MGAERKAVIESSRDQRVYDYLIAEVGQEAVDDAIARIAGNRRAYVSNIAKVLGVSIPQHIESTPPAEAREKLQGMLKMLKSKSKKKMC